MHYEIVHTDRESQLTTEVNCSKVLIREGAAIFVNSMGEVLKVIPLGKLVSIDLIE